MGSRPRHWRECLTPGCGRGHRSVTGHCSSHRNPVPVAVSTDGRVHIGAETITPAAAIDLANRIVDALETWEAAQ